MDEVDGVDEVDKVDSTGKSGGATWWTLTRITAVASLAGVLLGALFWLFTVNATANAAKEKADAHDKALNEKADKTDVRQGFEEIEKRLDEIQDFLMKRK